MSRIYLVCANVLLTRCCLQGFYLITTAVITTTVRLIKCSGWSGLRGISVLVPRLLTLSADTVKHLCHLSIDSDSSQGLDVSGGNLN